MDSCSKKQRGNQRINVFVRCRPLNDVEKKELSSSVVEVISDNKIVVKETCNDKVYKRTFTFDKVFGPSSSQVDVYEVVAHSLINDVIQGYNCTIFAYGQTGTGKTYTMEGERFTELSSWEKDPKAGIIPRILHQLFETLDSLNSETSVTVSYVELYNEELYDLLSPSNDIAKLKLFETSSHKGSVLIQPLEEIPVFEKQQVFSVFERGTARRQRAATLLNSSSNRSHTVFTVIVHVREIDHNNEVLKIGKLNLVDLAGSENIGRSGAVDKRAREAGSINQSLLTLGRVITALVEKGPHVPYRESKLTRILQDSLGGHTKTSIIATISPALCNVEETLSTLDYAFRAKDITNRPEVNQKLSNNNLIKENIREMDRLRRDLAACKEKRGILLDEKIYTSMQNDLISKSEFLKELKANKNDLQDELEKAKRSLVILTSSLKEKKDMLAHEVGFEAYLSTRLQKSYEEMQISKQAKKWLAFRLVDLDQFSDARMRAEQDMRTSSQQLLGICDKASSDVSALLKKLANIDDIASQNEEKREKYRESFRQLFEEIGTFTINLKEEYSNLLSNLTHEVDNALKTWKIIFNMTTSCFSNLANFHNQMFESLDTYISQIKEESCNAVLVIASKEKDFLQDYFASFSLKICTAFGVAIILLSKQINAINNFEICLKNQISDNVLCIRAFTEKIKEHLKNADNELQYLKQEEKKLILAQLTNKLHTIEEENCFKMEWTEKLDTLETSLESLKSLNFKHKQFSEQKLHQSKENIDSMKKLCNRTVNVTNLMKDEIGQMEIELVSNCDASYKSIDTSQRHCLEEVKTLNYNLVESEEKIKNLVEFESSDPKIFKDDENYIVNWITASQNAYLTNIKSASEQILEFKNILSSTMFPEEEIEKQCLQKLESMISSQKCLISEFEETFSKGNSLKTYLVTIKSRLDDLMKETLKVEHTGHTPTNRNYNSSTTLAFPHKSRYITNVDRKEKQMEILQKIEKEISQDREPKLQDVLSNTTSLTEKQDSSNLSKANTLETAGIPKKKLLTQKGSIKQRLLGQRQNSNLTPQSGKLSVERKLVRSRTLNI